MNDYVVSSFFSFESMRSRAYFSSHPLYEAFFIEAKITVIGDDDMIQ